jgi:hypothetical protein
MATLSPRKLLLLCVVVAAGLALAPGPAPAGGIPHGSVASRPSVVFPRGGGHVFPPRGVFPPSQFHRPFGHRPGFARPVRSFVPFGAFPSSVIVYVGAPAVSTAEPYASYDSPAYAAAPVVYATPAASTVSIAPSPPPPPTPSVVEYPNGRYELRGDGTSLPYTWVWVPNPPSAPPTPAPGPASADVHRDLYRWTDPDGVLHVTDRLSAVPKQYRGQARETSE